MSPTKHRIITLSKLSSEEIEKEVESKMEVVFTALVGLLESAPVGRVTSKASVGESFIRDLKRKGRKKNLGLRNLLKLLLAIDMDPAMFLERALKQEDLDPKQHSASQDPALEEALAGAELPPEIGAALGKK